MRSLESLEAYRVGRKVAVQTYRLTKIAPLNREFSLADQIRRAAASIPANTAEAYALGTRPQPVRGLRIALASAAELRTHLWIAKEVGVLPEGEAADRVLRELDRVTGLLIGLLKRSRARPGR